MSDRPLVMVVDDDRINTVITSELLEDFGIESMPASSAEEALELVKLLLEKKLDGGRLKVILMDHIMPGMSGVEATERIRKLCDIPVYGMSGGFTDQIRDEFIKAGAAELITKPINPSVMYKIACETLPEGSFTVPLELIDFKHDAAQEQDTKESLLKACLKGVQGLNYDRGLKHALGQETSYLRNLKTAAEEMEEYCAILEEYVHNSDTVKLKIAVHSLKTVFSIIGIKFMYHESEVVESAADKMIEESLGSTPNILFYEHVNSYKNNVRQIAGDIKRAIDEYDRITESGNDAKDYVTAQEPLDAREMAQVISYTLTALERFEYDYICEGLEILRRAHTGDARIRVEKAIEAVERFDYDTAKEIVNELSVLVQ
ncbi:MAG: response regulator [Lachnospiraceae bacterium]|nr:response regulator [Lachnospiraceae bacterium]